MSFPVPQLADSNELQHPKLILPSGLQSIEPLGSRSAYGKYAITTINTRTTGIKYRTVSFPIWICGMMNSLTEPLYVEKKKISFSGLAIDLPKSRTV